MFLELLPEVVVATLRLGIYRPARRSGPRANWFAPSDPEYGDAPGQVLCEHEESQTEFNLGFTKGVLTDIHVYRFRVETRMTAGCYPRAGVSAFTSSASATASGVSPGPVGPPGSFM